MATTREEIIIAIKAEGADDWAAVKSVLEDGEALAKLGFTDEDQGAIEDAHDLASEMAIIHPNYKF